MLGLRAWIVILTLTSFLAGLSAGLYAGRRSAADVAAPRPAALGSPFDPYAQRFLAEFDLPPERASLFRGLLGNYQSEIEAMSQRALASGMADMGPELALLGQRYRDYIRSYVLPEESRPQFDQLSEDALVWQGTSPAVQ